jgi:aromatic ring-opening dioxygenase LigB subunit
MSLVFAAITPHPPILVPAIGKENLDQLSATIDAFRKLEEIIYVSKVDTILIISPHGLVQSGSFSMNLSPEFNADFAEFGDFATKFSIRGDVGLTHRIRENLETTASLQLISQPKLDYGSAIPLFMLAQKLPQIKIIPLYYSGVDLKSHFEFGKLLNRELIYSQNRVAVVASGDLSHRLTQNSPAGYSPKAAKFDQKLIDLLQKNQTEEILRLNNQQVLEACECGLKSIAILLGILDGIKHEPQKLSYEAPFGVGYLVMNFKL